MFISDPAFSGMTKWRNALTTNTYDITRFLVKGKSSTFQCHVNLCIFAKNVGTQDDKAAYTRFPVSSYNCHHLQIQKIFW
jgi:hypothetical protein